MIKDGDRLDDEQGTMFSSAFGGQFEPKKEVLPNVEADLECTLEELYKGCVKKLKYNKKVVNPDGRTTQLQEETKDVEIFKGYDKNTVLTFPGYGNEGPAIKTCKSYLILADLIVRIKEKKHPKFKKVNKNDLVYVQKISLIDALNSVPVTIFTLDNRKIIVTMDEIISPQTVKTVKLEGMPIYNKEDPLQNLVDKEKKGDLFVKFDIIFPKFIEPTKKEEITNLLES